MNEEHTIATDTGRTGRQLSPEAAERVSAAAYGAIVAASTLAGTAAHGDVWSIVLVVVATNLVYWAAHVFAYTIGDRSAADTRVGRIVLHHMYVSGPIVTSTFLPITVVVLLETFGLDRQTATAWGIGTAASTLVAVAVSGAFLRGARNLALLAVAAGTVVLTGLLLWAKLSLH